MGSVLGSTLVSLFLTFYESKWIAKCPAQVRQKLEAFTQRCSVKNVFFEISQNSQENGYARISFSIKLQALGLHLY